MENFIMNIETVIEYIESHLDDYKSYDNMDDLKEALVSDE